MGFAFFILMGLAMVAVVVSLVLGMVFMVKTGEDNRRRSNKMMQARVTLQGIAIILFALAMMSQS